MHRWVLTYAQMKDAFLTASTLIIILVAFAFGVFLLNRGIYIRILKSTVIGQSMNLKKLCRKPYILVHRNFFLNGVNYLILVRKVREKNDDT